MSGCSAWNSVSRGTSQRFAKAGSVVTRVKLTTAGRGLLGRRAQVVVDARTSVVGSCNFDPRSLRINLEFFGVIRSSAFAAALEQVCVYERAHSRPIDMHQHENTPWYRRWLHRLAWWFRHWL